MLQVKDFLTARLPLLLADLEALVRLESPSRNVEGVNAVQNTLEGWLASLGRVARHPTPLGDVLHLAVPGRSGERVLLLAHADTVYPRGSWSSPWRIEGNRAYGPGVYDMKGGIVLAVWALRALREAELAPTHTVELLVTPDEEIESRSGRPFIEERAAGARAVLVLEPPTADGDLKVARKGVGTYRLGVLGRAAHQGTEPEKGVNAIVAASELVARLVALQDIAAGTTLGPNTIRGGTASNVVADRVDLEVDMRAWTLAEAERVDAAVRGFEFAMRGARLEIAGGLNRPPFEPGPGTLALLETARRVGADLGLAFGGARVGGGSDGNFTAALAPTLDGLGAVGDAAHQRDSEFVSVPDLAPRGALLAGMLLEA